MLPRRLAVSLLVLLSPLALLAKQPPPPDHWVGTWAASPMALDQEQHFGSQEMTVREMVHVSLGGPLTRVVLTNEFGTEPLRIGAAHVALASKDGSISLMSANALTFGGRSSVTIPPGALMVSDPVGLALQPMADVAVSLDVPAQTISHVSGHTFADQTSYVASGNQVGQGSMSGARPITDWPFLKGIEVRVEGRDRSVVCFGDSITDGAHSTVDANARWPDVLAKRLHDNRKTSGVGVLNQGIGGNRVLYEGYGPAALARFDRDVIAQAGVKYVILLEGINDIGHAYDPRRVDANGTLVPNQPATAEDLIVAYKQMVTRAHTHGIRVIGATLTPYTGAGYASPQGDAVRKALNEWIRTTKDLDGVIDFEKAVRDPNNPDVFAAFADSGDHLHPKDAGYNAMADAIDLDLFVPNKKQEPVTAKLPPVQ